MKVLRFLNNTFHANEANTLKLVDMRNFAPPLRFVHCFVWKGQVYNGGESDLSEMLLNSWCSIETLIYCPSDIQGGIMIRPHYHVGDRNKKQVFPKLRILGFMVLPYDLIPIDLGYICPELEWLVVFRNPFIPLRGWEQTQSESVQKCVKTYKNLKGIIVLHRTDSFPDSRAVKTILFTPKNCDKDVWYLIWMAFRFDLSSYFHRLNRDCISFILSYLHHPWRIWSSEFSDVD